MLSKSILKHLSRKNDPDKKIHFSVLTCLLSFETATFSKLVFSKLETAKDQYLIEVLTSSFSKIYDEKTCDNLRK